MSVQPITSHAAELSYDAFLSYSHALDGRLAPALRAAVHRFAKPWYRRATLRVFHDNANLSVNAGLWSSISEALAGSRHFVLLASPEAAQSPWVEREVDYWMRHRSRATMLIVLTGGEIRWDAAADDFDWARTTALPRCLSGWFAEEPLWLDLREIRSGDEISLRHPRFGDAVASLVSTLTAQPKSELVGEEVRQRRNLRRTITALITVFAVFLAGLAVSTTVAIDQLGEAQEQTRNALARQWAAEAETLRDQDPRTSLALGVEAVSTNRSQLSRRALLDTLTQSRFRGWFDGHDSGVVGLSFLPDGKTAASMGSDGTVLLWDVREGKTIATLPARESQVSGFSVSADGRLLAATHPDHANGSPRTTVRIWNIADPRHPRATKDIVIDAIPTVVSFAPDGRSLVISASLTVSVLTIADDGRTAQPRASLTVETWLVGAAISPDNRLLATASFDGKVILWDMTTPGAPVRTGLLTTRPDSQCAVAFSPDSTALLAEGANGGVVVWDVRDPGHPTTLATMQGHSYAVFDLSFSRDGTKAVTASGDGTAIVWDTTDRRAPTQLGRLSGHTGPVASVALSADGTRVLTGGNDHRVMSWDVANAEPTVTGRLEPRSALALYGLAVADRRHIAVTVDASDSAHLWDIANPSAPRHLSTIKHTIEPDPGEPFEPVLSPDGTFVLVANGTDVAELWDISDPVAPVQVDGLRGSGGYPRGGQFTGSVLTVWGDKAQDTRSWEVRRGAALEEAPTPLAMSRSAYRDPGGHLAVIPEYSRLEVWTVDDDGMSLSGVVSEHQQGVEDVVFTPDGKTMISAAADDTIMTWDLSSDMPTRMATLLGHTATVTKLAVNRAGTLLASVSQDERVMLWDISTPSEPIRLASLDGHSDVVSGVAFVNGDNGLLTASYDGAALVWDISALTRIAKDPVATACRMLGPGLDDQEWERHSPGVPVQRSCSST